MTNNLKEELWESYKKEELWKLYKKAPKEIQEAIFSEETAQKIYNISTQNELDISSMEKISKLIGNLFLGLAEPEKLEELLKLELKIEKDKTEKIVSEINQFIITPLKDSLEKVYNKKIILNVPKEKKKDIYKEEI